MIAHSVAVVKFLTVKSLKPLKIACANIYTQLRQKDGKLKLSEAMDGGQVFTEKNFYKLYKSSKNYDFDGIRIEDHSTEKVQRGIVNL